MIDPTPYRALAVAVVQSAVDDLKARHGAHEIEFFADARQSEMWCAAAGLDWEATQSRLRADGHMAPRPAVIAPRKPRVPMPTRTLAYQHALRNNILARLPTTPEMGSTTREVASACRIYYRAASNVLVALRRLGVIAQRSDVRRGGTTAVWWKLPTAPCPKPLDTRTTRR